MTRDINTTKEVVRRCLNQMLEVNGEGRDIDLDDIEVAFIAVGFKDSLKGDTATGLVFGDGPNIGNLISTMLSSNNAAGLTQHVVAAILETAMKKD